MAREMTSRTISVILNRLRGIPRSAGSSQANAFICAISSGKKNEGSTSPGSIDQSLLPLIEKTLTPLTNCLSWKIKLLTNLLILHAFCSHENYLSSNDIPIRCRISSGQGAQVIVFFLGQNDPKWTFSWHDILPYYGRYHTLISSTNQEIIRNCIYEENH